MPLMAALERQRQMDFCEIRANLLYIASPRTDGTTGRPCLKNGKTTTKKTHEGSKCSWR